MTPQFFLKTKEMLSGPPKVYHYGLDRLVVINR